MKKMKFAVIVAALVAIVSMSSCLGNSESTVQTQAYYVTVIQDAVYGYKFLMDDGTILVPNESLSSYASKLGSQKRVLLYFKLAENVNNPSQKQYSISFEGFYPVETKRVIDLCDNKLAADTLAKENCNINSWSLYSAYKGYITIIPSFYYGKYLPYFDLAYNSEEVKDNKITFTAYFDARTRDTYSTVSNTYSFIFPEDVYSKITGDSLEIEVKAHTTDGISINPLKTKISANDLLPYYGY